MQPNIALLSGEVSGDLVGGALARMLREARPDLALWGMGSRHMTDAGVELIYDSGEWSAIGIVEAFKVFPRLRWSVYPHIVQEIIRRKPAVVILIDFGAFNIKVAHKCKEHGIPVLYYFPPGSWRKKGRVNPEIARVTDRIATPYPWSAERLKGVGANVEFVGHPLLELVHPTMTRAQFAERFGMEPGRPIIGLLPGSRGFEVKYNTPAMLGAACLIHREMPDAQFVFGVASPSARQRIEQSIEAKKQEFTADFTTRQESGRGETEVERDARSGARLKLATPEGVTVSPEELKRQLALRQRALEEAGRYAFPSLVLAEGITYDVMAHADALLICSGTATLEATLLGTPMVILYRFSKLMEIEARIRRSRPEHCGLPNIIADKRIVPEHLQFEATPERLAEDMLRFLRDPARRAEVKAALQAVRSTLGEPGASRRTAQIALELAGLNPA